MRWTFHALSLVLAIALCALSKAVSVCWTVDALPAPCNMTKSSWKLHPVAPRMCCAHIQISTAIFSRCQQHLRTWLVTQQAADKFIQILNPDLLFYPLQGQGPVFFLAATLRPETMYGQTNCWVLPEGQYGAYRGLNNEIYIMTHRSALNLSYQDRMPVTGQPECMMSLVGQDLIGTPLSVRTAIPSLPVV